MRTSPGDLLLLVAVVAASLFVYHAFLVPGGAPSAPARNLADLERRIAALEQGGEPTPVLAGRGDDARLRRLEDRVAALEARDTRSDGERSWREADVEAFREGLRQVQALEQREREARSFAAQVANVAPQSDERARAQAVDLLVAYLAEIRALSPAGDAPLGPDERAELNRRTDELRRQLERDLARIVGEEAAKRLTGAAPGGWPPPSATGPPIIEDRR